jgi:hypothetical protein
MVADAMRGFETRARKRKRDLAAQVGVSFPGLPFDVAVSIVKKHLPDPADLAVLRAVSKGMRDAVDATGRKVEEFEGWTAARRGYLSSLKCQRRHGRLSDEDEGLLCAAAARTGDIEAVKALRAENFPWDWRTCAFAAGGGQLKFLKWARTNECWWKGTCCWAAGSGHLEVLKWLRANGCPVDEYTCANAAQKGHFEVLKWARANGCPWDEKTCAFAAENGHLEILKWARANGCPWDEDTCENATREGHLEVLKWARENGCPWDELTLCDAASKGYFEDEETRHFFDGTF